MSGVPVQPVASEWSEQAAVPSERLLAPPDLLLAAGCGVLAGLIYWLGSAPGILFGDGGELQFAAWTAGLPHPTGYPLYILLGWAWSHLMHGMGLASPARAMNLFSVLSGALAVSLTYLLALALIELGLPRAPRLLQRMSALLAALTFAFTPTFWGQALVTEVYTLHAVFLALLLGLAVRWRKDLMRERSVGPDVVLGFRRSPAPALIVLALVLGLSLTHHRTTLLLVPVLVFFVWGQDGYRLRRPRWLITLGLLTTIPLLLYLFVPLRAPATPYLLLRWGPDQVLDLINRSPQGLVGYVLGRSFAGEFQSLQAALGDVFGLPRRFVAEIGLVGLGLAVLGLICLALSGRRRLFWLTASSFLVLTGFNLVYTIEDIQVFYIGPYLIASCWIGLGAAFTAQEIYQWLARRRTSPVPSEAQAAAGAAEEMQPGEASVEHKVDRLPLAVAAMILAVPLIALPLHSFLQHAEALDRSGHTRPEHWWRQLLAANPATDAILLSNDRDELMPLWYLQQVEDKRPDLTGVFPGLLPGKEWENIGRLLEQALATGRPIGLIKPMPGLEVKGQLALNDSSGLTPVLGPAVMGRPQRMQDSVLGDQVRLVGYDVSPVSAKPGDTVQVTLYWQPLRELPVDYTSFLHVRLADGTKLDQSDKLLGGVFYPTRLWEPGEVLADRHTVHIPDDAPPGPYELFAGLYELVGQEARTMGSVTLTGRIGGEPPAAARETRASTPTYANFNDEVLLIGYSLGDRVLALQAGSGADEEPVLVGDVLPVTLMWQAARPMDRDATVFVHLLAPGGAIIAQLDAPPFAGDYPTSVWQQGELLTDTYALPLPSFFQPGIYQVAVGLSDASSQERLPASDDVGQRFPADQVLLSEVEIRGP